MTSTRKEPWVWTLAKAQVRNPEAEAMGKGPWSLFVVVILLTSILAAFPFVNASFVAAWDSKNPAHFPGLPEVFEEIFHRGWALQVEQGRLTTGPDVPAQVQLGAWTVIFEPAGGDPNAIAQVAGGSGTTLRKVIFFGRTHLGLLDEQTHSQFDGTWEKLNGFQMADLAKIPADKMVAIVLYAAATAKVVQTMYSVMLLMFVQVVFLTFVLGFLLSLSKVHASGTVVGPKRAAGFLSSLRSTGFVALGPGLAVSVIFALIPSASSLAWVGFTLLLGVRIVVLYMARFRAKTRPSS